MKLCFEDERSNKSMNFILLSLIVAIVTTNSSTGKVPEKRVCALRDETCEKILCKGRMIVLDAKKARVASVERGTCVCLFHRMASTQSKKPSVWGTK